MKQAFHQIGIAGRISLNSDALSRRPCSGDPCQYCSRAEELYLDSCETVTTCPVLSISSPFESGPLLMLAYRSSIHESTGISPYLMMFGRHPNLPIDLIMGRLFFQNHCKWSCRLCPLNKTFKYKGDCRRHVETFHFGFCYLCKACGKINPRKTDLENHRCNSRNPEVVLLHRESGKSSYEANQLRRSMDSKVDASMMEELHFEEQVPQPISPINRGVMDKLYSSEQLHFQSSPEEYDPEHPELDKRVVSKTSDIPSEISTTNNTESSPLAESEDVHTPSNSDALIEITADDVLAELEPGTSITKEMDETLAKLPEIKRKIFQAREGMVDEVFDMYVKSLHKVSLCVGGKCFDTSLETLQQEPTSLISQLVTFESVVDNQKVFIDRDPSHFKFIINYLRYDCRMPTDCLPSDPQVLHELRMEAQYFRLPRLCEAVDRKLRALNLRLLNK